MFYESYISVPTGKFIKKTGLYSFDIFSEGFALLKLFIMVLATYSPLCNAIITALYGLISHWDFIHNSSLY